MTARGTLAVFLLAISATIFPISAGAQSYASVSGGLVLQTDADFTNSVGGGGEVTFDPGFLVLAEVGSGVKGYRGRMGLEFGYRSNDVDQVSFDGLGSTSDVNGDVEAFSFMINGHYDFSPGEISPFVLGGLGVAHIEAAIDSAAGDVRGDDTVFAYQFGVGLSFPLSTTMNVEGSYRYFGTEDPELDGIEADYAAHTLLASLRLRF